MHEYNQFGIVIRLYYGFGHIFHGALLSLPSRSQIMEEGEERTEKKVSATNNWFLLWNDS